MAEDTKGTSAKESAEAKKKYTLHLQRSKERKEGVIYANITHMGFPVHGGLLEVPIDGQLDVDQETYDAIMKHKLTGGYSWAGSAPRKATPDSVSERPKPGAPKPAPTTTSTTDTVTDTTTPAPPASSK